MYAALKDLTIGDQLSIDDKSVFGLTRQEDFEVMSSTLYSQEEGEVLIMEISDDFFLIAHTLNGDPRYYIYELNYDGSIEDVEEEGIRLLDSSNEFKARTKIKVGTKSITCKTLFDPVYDLIVESDSSIDQPVSLACYKTSSKTYPYLFAEVIGDFMSVYQGIRIQQTTIVI